MRSNLIKGNVTACFFKQE